MCADDHYDFAIIGAGISGSTLALALSKLYKEPSPRPKVLLLERNEALIATNSENSKDTRALAISLGALRRLDELGVGEAFNSRGEPITTIHVSDLGHIGRVELVASDSGLPFFGKVVLLSEVETALWEQLSTCQNIVKFIKPCSVCSVTDSIDGQIILTASGKQYRTKTIIIAEGGNSQLCQSLGVEYLKSDFKQTAIVTSVSFSHPKKGGAWERFTSTGPLAILPIADNWFSLVWCLENTESSRLLHASECDFKRELQKAFGFRAGRIERIGQRLCFPLQQSLSTQQAINSSVYLFGNAAHMLHPVAGQGFNLTVRDISFFVSAIAGKIISSNLPLPLELGRFYDSSRQLDVKETSHYTSYLISTFTDGFFPVVAGRSAGLAAISRSRTLRNKIISFGVNIKFI